jgi:hypothetical protein
VSGDIEDAKRRLPLPDLMRRLGLGEHAKKSALCPFHDDRRNSFSVWRNDAGLWLWKCHTGCGEGDEIDFLARHKNISKRDAITLFLEMAGVAGTRKTLRAQKPNGETQTPTPIDWQACVDAFTSKHVDRLAEWRGYSIEFCSWLRQNRLVGLYDNCLAFPVHDSRGSVVAVHYRIKDGVVALLPARRKGAPACNWRTDRR